MPFADSNRAKIHYALEGPAGKPVLVLSNSLGTDFSMWDPQIPEFTKSFRVLRYDTRGHGKSSVTPGPYSAELLANDVLTLADSLKLDRFHFCGLSMGGMTGMWLAVNHPKRLSKLIISSAAAKFGTLEMWNKRIETIRKQGMKPAAAAAIERWFTPAFRAKNLSTVGNIHRILESTKLEGYISNCAAVRDFDFRDQLGKISVPTLVISGTHDPSTTPAEGHFLADHIPGSRYVELNGAHLCNIEDADRFTKELIKFLDSERLS
jgi:3-oxoadipate enol-lactonase